MDRARFEHLLAAYGADFRRWPEAEREAGAAFATSRGGELRDALMQARSLDGALELAREPHLDERALAARVLAAAPRAYRWRMNVGAALAMAACAAFGVVLGYGGGMLAPPAEEDEAYFALAFEAPLPVEDEG